MKIVIDTNIIASSIYFGGKHHKLSELVIEEKIDVCVTNEIIFEYEEIIKRLSLQYKKRKENISLDDILSHCKIVTPQKHFQICRDPNDDKFIDCAVEGKCIYIVSGDKDLLVLENVLDVQIVTVADFFAQNADLFVGYGE